MTRVTMVGYDDEPPLGGQGVVLRGMRAALVARGHSVATISGRGENAIAYPRVTGRAPLDFSLHLNRHPELIERLDGDVVHAHGGPGGVLLLRAVGAPVVYTAHHTYRQAHRPGSAARLMSPLEARAYRRAARVLTVSASTARAVRALGVPPARVEVLAPGVDVPEVLAAERQPARLLFAGRWEPEKGVLDALTVMTGVLAARPGASAVVVGGGSLDAEVRARAAAVPGIEVAGRIDEPRLAAEYARAAVVIMPSRYEGLGLVALEAQAHRAAVAGYDVDGLRDAVPQAEMLVPAGDTAALTAVCLRLIDDPQQREDAAARGHEFVRAAHSWEAVSRRLEEVYAAVVAQA